MKVQKQPYGRLPDGTAVDKYTLATARGLTAEIITYGGILTSLAFPDRRGKTANVNLGFDTLEQYLAGNPYFGALVGRFGNRIARGAFTIEGKQYRLACNDGPNHLHGGLKAFDKVVWKAKPFQEKSSAGVVLSHTSPDGEEGYPGTLRVTVTYRLSEDNGLTFEYLAKTDKPTPVNLTQHSYWNLAGAGTVLDHELTLDCPFYLPVDSGVAAHRRGAERPGHADGFHLRPSPWGGTSARWAGATTTAGRPDRSDRGFRRIALLYEPSGGRGMEVWTTMPGVQLYTGNFLNGLAAPAARSTTGTTGCAWRPSSSPTP